jgi:hypothetical protein
MVGISDFMAIVLGRMVLPVLPFGGVVRGTGISTPHGDKEDAFFVVL